MKYFEETTKWTDNNAKNGSYYLDDSKTWMVAYQAPGESEYRRFKSPLRIDKRGRTFKAIKDGESDSLYIVKTEVTKPTSKSIEVSGSNGAKYYVTKLGNSLTCTCQGFQFRRKCRHTDQITITE